MDMSENNLAYKSFQVALFDSIGNALLQIGECVKL